MRQAARCEWCQHFLATPGGDLCVECLKHWVAAAPELAAAPASPCDLGLEDFFAAIRSIGGNL